MTENYTPNSMITSVDTAELFTALVAAQANMTQAVRGSFNPFFKKTYASLGDIAEACMPALNEEGIAVIQGGLPTAHNGSVTITTRFCHTSGQWIEGSLTLPLAKSDPQGLCSAVTYGRRYLLAAMGGVIMADDDGNAASGNDSTRPPAEDRAPAPERRESAPAPAASSGGQRKGDPAKPATDKQCKMLYAKAMSKGMDKDSMKKLGRETTGKESSREYTMGDIDKMVTAIGAWSPSGISQQDVAAGAKFDGPDADGLHDDQNLPF